MGAGFSVSGMIHAGHVQPGDRLICMPQASSANVRSKYNTSASGFHKKCCVIKSCVNSIVRCRCGWPERVGWVCWWQCSTHIDRHRSQWPSCRHIAHSFPQQFSNNLVIFRVISCLFFQVVFSVTYLVQSNRRIDCAPESSSSTSICPSLEAFPCVTLTKHVPRQISHFPLLLLWAGGLSLPIAERAGVCPQTH